MAATASIVLLGKRWVPVSPERRALVLDVRFDILDPEPVFQLGQEIRYAPAAFAGMTAIQAQTAILTTGIGGHPGLKTIALDLLEDWNQAVAIRQLTFPIVFNP